MKLYVDTNVYLDYFLKRRKTKEALKVFEATLKCKYEIVIFGSCSA